MNTPYTRERPIWPRGAAAIVMARETALHRVTAAEAHTLIVAHGCSAQQRARLLDAIRATSRLQAVDESNDLFRSGDGLQAPDVVVLGVASEAARDVVALVRDLRARCPGAAIVAYCGGVHDAPASIGALAAAGVHQFVFTDVNDRGVVLRAILESARQQCTAEVVMSALRLWTPAAIHPLIEAVLSRPAMVADVRSLADALGVHRKTLFNRCVQASFLTPAELLTWVRLALVAYLLETTGFTVEHISIVLGYPSPTALRNTIKRYTGCRATMIRAQGGLQLVVDRFSARIRQSAVPASLESSAQPPLHVV